MPYVLDTDITSALQHKNPIVVTRVVSLPRSELFFTIVSFEEQCAGRLNVINRQSAASKLVEAYERLRETLIFYATVSVLSYDDEATRFDNQLRLMRGRMGTKDRRIAAITLAHGCTLVTRNVVHFRDVPGLVVEDWMEPLADRNVAGPMI